MHGAGRACGGGRGGGELGGRAAQHLLAQRLDFPPPLARTLPACGRRASRGTPCAVPAVVPPSPSVLPRLRVARARVRAHLGSARAPLAAPAPAPAAAAAVRVAPRRPSVAPPPVAPGTSPVWRWAVAVRARAAALAAARARRRARWREGWRLRPRAPAPPRALLVHSRNPWGVAVSCACRLVGARVPRVLSTIRRTVSPRVPARSLRFLLWGTSLRPILRQQRVLLRRLRAVVHRGSEPAICAPALSRPVFSGALATCSDRVKALCE